MHNILIQSLLALAMFVTTAAAGLVPLKLFRWLEGKPGEAKSGNGGRWMSLLSCFSGGVFMATCFLDIVPHIGENYSALLEATKWEPALPLPQFFTCIGFFLVYFIEQLCMRIFAMKGHGHSHGALPHQDEITPPTQSKNGKNNDRRHLSESGNGNVMSEHEGRAMLDDRPLKHHRSHQSLHELVMEESVRYATSADEEGSFLKSLTFAIAMSFHSILEGFALGVQDTPTRIVSLFLSLFIHKGIEAFSVGLQIVKGNRTRVKVVICTVFIYALMTPIGSALGTWLEAANIDPIHKESAVVVLESLAAGTFIYVTFLEVLASEKENEHDSLLQLLAIFLGFVLITVLQVVMGHGHGGEEGH
ncbi:unnamed protein product, partial [Mesorhabditis spiculigera]